MLLALASTAFADSISLDTGATIEGDLARYELGGDCQISVTEGELAGVIVIVPCHRVSSFVRTSIRTPVPIGLEEEVAKKARTEDPYAAGESAAPAPPARPAETPAVAAAEEPLYDEPLFPADATTPILPAPPKEAPAPEAAPVPAPPAPTEAPPSPGAQRAPLMDYIDAPASGEALEEAAEPAAEEAPVTHHAVRF